MQKANRLTPIRYTHIDDADETQRMAPLGPETSGVRQLWVS